VAQRSVTCGIIPVVGQGFALIVAIATRLFPYDLRSLHRIRLHVWGCGSGRLRDIDPDEHPGECRQHYDHTGWIPDGAAGQAGRALAFCGMLDHRDRDWDCRADCGHPADADHPAWVWLEGIFSHRGGWAFIIASLSSGEGSFIKGLVGGMPRDVVSFIGDDSLSGICAIREASIIYPEDCL